MNPYEKLLLENKAWAQEMNEENPDFFKRLSAIQTPEFLWIGCSDSRVPADKITGTQPGEIFVHRNIANMVVHTDVNLLSVLDYAVTYLKVKHVIVCGHYGCGGVKAAMSNDDFNQVLKQCIQALPFLQREALVLREYQKLDYEEIARILHKPLGTIKTLIFRARSALKDKLLPYIEESKGGSHE